MGREQGLGKEGQVLGEASPHGLQGLGREQGLGKGDRYGGSFTSWTARYGEGAGIGEGGQVWEKEGQVLGEASPHGLQGIVYQLQGTALLVLNLPV